MRAAHIRDSIYVVWQVQARKSRAGKWVNKGRYETRSNAREEALELRDLGYIHGRGFHGYGFGNTRVIRIEVPHRAKKEVAA